MHRACAIEWADNRGYEFKCPMCADQKVFQKYIRLRGVFIPQRDTLTQAHNQAYQETQTKYCEAEVCLLSPKDRNPRAEEKLLTAGKTIIAKCGYCGKAFHQECAEKQGVFIDTDEDDEKEFKCSSCMDFSDHDLNISLEDEVVDVDESEDLNAGFDLGSDCSNISEVGVESQEEGPEIRTSEFMKKFKFGHHYKWIPCPGHSGHKDFREIKLNLFMNSLPVGTKRKREE